MTGRLAIACAIAAVTLLGFFEFPGHTYLHSDTQIYVPMMEHIWNPAAFPRDLVATKPHLSYTIYDELAIGLRRAFGVPFEASLIAQQLVYRGLQVWGIYLLATAIPLSSGAALAVAAMVSLGATIAGPAVLLIEYEPVPRGFAIGLVFLAIGLVARGKPVWASVAASLGFLYHAPTTFPFWFCFLPSIVWKRQWRAWIPLGLAVGLILVAAHYQAGVIERQHFFFRIDAGFEELQRLRAPYNWVSVWAGSVMWQYIGLWLASLVAFWRVRPQAGKTFLIGLPLVGLLCVPASYVLLEDFKWGLIPQYQPARALLFVTAMAMILSAAAGVRAVEARRWWEAWVWLVLVFALPMKGRLVDLDARQWALAAVLAVGCAVTPRKFLLAPVAAAYFLIPMVGRVQNYPDLETADLGQLEAYARDHTDPKATFVFADAGHALDPGIFRVRASRSVYVDWKSGGQVNYYRSLADEWWSRWQQLHELQDRSPDFGKLAGLGIDYVVLPASDAVAGAEPEYRNASYAVYRLRK